MNKNERNCQLLIKCWMFSKEWFFAFWGCLLEIMDWLLYLGIRVPLLIWFGYYLYVQLAFELILLRLLHPILTLKLSTIYTCVNRNKFCKLHAMSLPPPILSNNACGWNKVLKIEMSKKADNFIKSHQPCSCWKITIFFYAYISLNNMDIYSFHH